MKKDDIDGLSKKDFPQALAKVQDMQLKKQYFFLTKTNFKSISQATNHVNNIRWIHVLLVLFFNNSNGW